MRGERFYITTAIYYVNDVPHIGHFYTTLISDVAARFKRLDGCKVKFSTGTDEHGQKVATIARERGITTRLFADEVSESFRGLLGVANFSCDDFIRTTEERHKKSVLALWERLNSNGQIYMGHYSGFYSVRDESFYQERDLIDGKAPTGADVEWLEEPGYFFKLSEWQDRLLEFYDNNPDFVTPSGRVNEVVNFVKSGLRDLSISRSTKSLTWGIGVPGDNEHVIYIWVDALANYLTVLGFPETQNRDYEEYWCNAGAVHVIGKDILKFHAIYWPAILMAAGLPLPKKIVAHGWWLNEGQKISKSIGNVIDPYKLIASYGLDNVRYFCLAETPIGSDANFSMKSFVERVNCELANNLGNLVQRTVTLLHKGCSGKIPKVSEEKLIGEEALPDYSAILVEYRAHMSEYRFFEALKFIMGISAEANEYIARKAPWKLIKEDSALAEAVLFKLLEYIRCVGIMLQPFLPESAEKILNQIALPCDKRALASFSERSSGGMLLPEPSHIFSRLEMPRD